MELTKEKLKQLFDSITGAPVVYPLWVYAFCNNCAGGRAFLDGRCEHCGVIYNSDAR